MEENFSIAYYLKRLEHLSEERRKYKKRANAWVFIRLFTFLCLGLHCYFSFPYSFLAVLAILGLLLLFIYFIRKSAENKEHLTYIDKLILLNKNEIKAGNHDFSPFNSGEEHKSASHPFSYDIDLFGKGGFFQFFNRTVTKKGEQTLVKWLLNGIENRKLNVEAIDELQAKRDWNQDFLAYGDTLDKEELAVSIHKINDEKLSFPPAIIGLRFFLPCIAITISTLYYLDILNGVQFIVGAIVVLLPVKITLSTMNRLKRKLSAVSARTQSLQKQMEVVEKEDFSSKLLTTIYEELFTQQSNGKKAFITLSKLIKEAEYRDNVLVGVILNFFLAWDFRLLVKFEKWKAKYGSQIKGWEERTYELEALISGANFRANFINHTSIPILTNSSKKIINIVELGHPLIPIQKMITNDFQLSEQEQFSIITGPNMAGKSTFLRSIGINLMLARAGFHVFAKEFHFPDMKLYSSMRTTDNLDEETSYFYAELLRLRFIVDAIERGEQVFIILDEILKGTNSKDKAEGSALFLEKLIQLKAKGIIATHDLSLTKLEKEYSCIVNNYFDTLIANDTISFDYCIRKGVAKNMNASFLLRKMGLIEVKEEQK